MENKPLKPDSAKIIEKVSQFEKLANLENTKENVLLEKSILEKPVKNKEEKVQTSATTLINSVNSQTDHLTYLEKEVESILASGLDDLYNNLEPAKKIEFRSTGEKTAKTIALMINSVKYKIYEILDLIRGWLLLVPGINKFFLEQEVKIKTDKIISLEKKSENN